MSLWEAVLSALKSVWSNKMRSALTMLGIAIGIFAVAALISIVQASTSSITESIEGEGTQLIIVSITGTRTANAFDMDDVEAMEELKGVEYVAPNTASMMTLKNDTDSIDVNVTASNQHYDDVNNYKMLSGRWISENDEARRNRVVVVGIDVAEKLYGTLDVVGEKIIMSGKPFVIIGILEEQGDSMMGSGDEVAFIPFATGQRLMSSVDIRSIYVAAESSEDVNTAMQSLEDYMDKKTNGNEDEYQMFSMGSMLALFDETTAMLTLLLGAIAGISLLVGGIGIMNIMLVSVSERTREIGVRKAIGATRANIMIQFLIEAIIVSALGGLFGLIFAQIGVSIAGKLMDMSISLQADIVITALIFSAAVGIIFGLYPAAKASKLNPIEALRYE